MRLHLLSFTRYNHCLIRKHFWGTHWFFFWCSNFRKKAPDFPPCEAELYKLYWAFPSWHIGSVCIRWGTWFIAAATGPVWWVISLAQNLSTHFPQLGKGQKSVLQRGPLFFTVFCSLCGWEKGLCLLGWECFYMFGFSRCMNGSVGLWVRNAPCLITVVAMLFLGCE